MACLVDQCTIRDGWYGGNRQDWSSGAGNTVTQNVYWNTGGGGIIRSYAYGWGYIIGTEETLIHISVTGNEGTEPQDFLEGQDTGALLDPQSLYEDQLARRLNP